MVACFSSLDGIALHKANRNCEPEIRAQRRIFAPGGFFQRNPAMAVFLTQARPSESRFLCRLHP